MLKLLTSRSRLSNSRGMTLIEIIIVVTILGTLLTILVGKIQQNLNRAKYKEASLRMSQVTRALDMYYTDCGKYPATIQGLMEKDDCSNWGPEAYIKNKSETEDSWKHQFVYEPSGSSYTLKSLGADGKEGGTGFNADINYGE